MAAPTNTYCDYATGNDYKGASFTDGAYTSATKTLVKASAFAASKVNHWLYLTDNGSGVIVEGYYKIATWTDANTVILATDAGAGSNATDVKCIQADGTTTLPWRSVQGAFDLITRDATNGDQVNVKAGTAQVSQAALTLATYGTPTAAAPLILRGYTATASDGGKGEIDSNGAAFWAGNYPFWLLIDLKIHNFGNNNGITGGANQYATVYHCEVYKGASNPINKYLIYLVAQSKIIANFVHDAGTGGIGMCGGYGTTSYNYMKDCPTGIAISAGQQVIRNLIVDCATNGINYLAGMDGAGMVDSNAIYVSSAATGTGINYNTQTGAMIINNIIEGYSGAGGTGIKGTGEILLEGMNAIYNCTTPTSLGDVDITIGADVALAASPFVDAAGGNFALNTAVAGAIDGAFPGVWYGPAATTDHADIGAVQNGAGAAGGGSVRIVPTGKVGL